MSSQPDDTAVGAGSLGSEDSAPGLVISRRPVLRFVIIFASCMAVYYAVTVVPAIKDRLFPPMHRLYALACGRVLTTLGYDVEVADRFILVPDRPEESVEVRRGCDAIEPTALYVAAVLALPLRVRRRWLGVLGGVLILALINVVRVVTLFMVGVYYPSAFDFMHTQVWQALFIFVAVLLFVGWIRLALPRPLAQT